jgi:glycosyltransferase 2 family protein
MSAGGEQPQGERTRLERTGDLVASASTLRPEDANARRALYASIAVLIALGIALAVIGAVGDLPEIELELRPEWIAVAIGGMAVYLLYAVELWRWLLHALGPPLLHPLVAASVWFTSVLGRYVPTSLLYPVMRVAAGDRVGVPGRISLVALVYEVGMAFTAALLVSAYFVIDLPKLSDQPARYLVAVVPVLAIIALHPRIFHNLTDRFLTRFGREPLPVSLDERTLFALLAGYAGYYLFSGASTYGLAELVEPSVSISDFPIIAGAFAVATAVSLVAFILPAGLLAREAMMVVALSPVMDTGPAIAVAVLSRILQIAVEIAFAIATPLLARRAPAAAGSGS